ncbi:STAS domain-containing protein [Streptomyces sp. NPDC015220]|uniref:STAS domain-containing protein n=1 Tax=Streptomyces sp. NPDC015220 TaxID=3364947 RepID=UPI0036F7C7C2
MGEKTTRPTVSHTVRTIGATTVVTLRGDVDFAARILLGMRLDTLSSGPRPDLLLDLRSVSFVDCAGLGLLCRVRNRVLARGGRLRLVTGSAPFRRLLRRTGLAGVFELLPEPGGTEPARPPTERRPLVPAVRD